MTKTWRISRHIFIRETLTYPINFGDVLLHYLRKKLIRECNYLIDFTSLKTRGQVFFEDLYCMCICLRDLIMIIKEQLFGT